MIDAARSQISYEQAGLGNILGNNNLQVPPRTLQRILARLAAKMIDFSQS